jgi:hypothetical protein
LRRGGAAHLAHALLQCVHAVNAGMHVGEAAAIGVERQFAAGGGVALGEEGSGLAAAGKAQILQAVDRQMRKACPWQRTGGVVDHQVPRQRAVGPATRKAREEVKSCIWLTCGVSRRFRRRRGGRPLLCEVADALGGNKDQGAPPPSVTRPHCNKRNG